MIEAAEWQDRARAAHKEGDLPGALHCYQAAAASFQEAGDSLRQAHALRHAAELQAKAGDGAGALQSIAAAYEIYAANKPSALEMANTFRVGALAHEAAGEPWKAQREWLEALALYTQEGIQAGVEEATERLKTLGVG